MAQTSKAVKPVLQAAKFAAGVVLMLASAAVLLLFLLYGSQGLAKLAPK